MGRFNLLKCKYSDECPNSIRLKCSFRIVSYWTASNRYFCLRVGKFIEWVKIKEEK